MANLPDLTAKVKVEFTDLEAAAVKAKLLGDVLKKELGGGDVSKAMNDVAGGISGIAKNAESGEPAIAQLGASLAPMAGSMSSLVGVIVLLGVALSPVLVQIAAFTVGLAAAFTVMSLGLGLMGGLVVGMVALAAATGQLGDTSGKGAASAAELAQAQANLTAAQKKYGDSSYQAQLAQQKLTALQEQGVGPLQALRDHFQSLATTLGQEVAPAARDVLTWVNAMIDPIAKLPAQVINWVNSNGRLYNSLDIIGQLINDFADFLSNKAGPAIGKFLDAWISRAPQWEQLWKDTLGKAADAVDGLLTNLTRLSDWFNDRMPALGTVTGQTFGFIGTLIQGLGTAAGAVVDFFITHWPQISSTAQSVFNDIKTGFDFVLPLLGLAIAAFQHLDPVIQFIRDHADSLKPVLYAVGGLLVIMAASAILTGAAVTLLVAGIVGLAYILSVAVAWIRDNVIPWFGHAGDIFYQLGSAVHAVADAFDRLMNSARAAADAVRNVPVLGGLAAAALPGMATGGVAAPGQTFMVGEQGPEIGYALPGGGVSIMPIAGSTAEDPRPSRTNQLLADQNQLLRAFLQALVNQPSPVGRWPYAGRTV